MREAAFSLGAPSLQRSAVRAVPRTHTSFRTPTCASVRRRALGVDYGMARVGLAVSVGIAPRLLGAVRTKDADEAATQVARAAQAHVAEEIVLGLPLNAAGERGDQAKATLHFAARLSLAAPRLPLLLVDERFTTAEADEQLAALGVPREERAGCRDSVAAAIILVRHFGGPGEVQAVPYYTPPPLEVGHSSGAQQVVSYKEWRAARMAEAAAKTRRMKRRKG